MAGRTLDTRVTVTDRSELSKVFSSAPGTSTGFDQAERRAANLSEWPETVAPRMTPFSGG